MKTLFTFCIISIWIFVMFCPESLQENRPPQSFGDIPEIACENNMFVLSSEIFQCCRNS